MCHIKEICYFWISSIKEKSIHKIWELNVSFLLLLVYLYFDRHIKETVYYYNRTSIKINSEYNFFFFAIILISCFNIETIFLLAQTILRFFCFWKFFSFCLHGFYLHRFYLGEVEREREEKKRLTKITNFTILCILMH